MFMRSSFGQRTVMVSNKREPSSAYRNLRQGRGRIAASRGERAEPACRDGINQLMGLLAC
jgi:hypothetical protein